jgi:hypothetical protein
MTLSCIKKDEVLCKCEEIALSQHISLKKAEGTKLKSPEKLEYIKQWKKEIKVMLEEPGIRLVLMQMTLSGL